MILMAVILGILLLLMIVYLFCLKPNVRRKNQMKPFERVYIAHRGLFNNEKGIPENSMAAFCKAVEYGYGIELDVRLTRDKKLVVFHDEFMFRMCGVNRLISECTYDELKKYHLKNSFERIPLLCEVLNATAGRVPIIIEIKTGRRYRETVQILSEALKDYRGIYCVESFNPFAIAWYRKKQPQVIRGQLAVGFPIWKKKQRGVVFTNLLMNWYSKPDFIACNYKQADLFPYRICRNLYKAECAGWTIRSQTELEKAKKDFQIIIFDSFLPKM